MKQNLSNGMREQRSKESGPRKLHKELYQQTKSTWDEEGVGKESPDELSSLGFWKRFQEKQDFGEQAMFMERMGSVSTGYKVFLKMFDVCEQYFSFITTHACVCMLSLFCRV